MQSDTDTSPIIGIALAAYRPVESFFKEQLESILNQSFTRWVCVITFDSKIAELNQTAELKDILKDPRFLVFENEKQLGHRKNFERSASLLIEKFTSIQAIAFCDQDDIWYRNKLEYSLNKLRTLPDYSCVHSDMHLLHSKDGSFELLRNQSGEPIHCWNYERRIVTDMNINHFISRNFTAGTAMLIDVNLIKKFPQIPSTFTYHDYWYGILAAIYGKLIPIYTPLYAYRQHGKNVEGASEYIGLITPRKRQNFPELLRECKNRFVEASARANALLSETDFKSVKTSCLFVKKLDLGLSLLIQFFHALLKKDMRLARASLALSIGKLMFVFSKQK